MASMRKPGDEDCDRPGDHNDINRGGPEFESVDEEVIAAGTGEVILESDDFPSGGGESIPDRGRTAGASVAPSDRGSTGRGSTDAGKTDSEGTPGGGTAGAAGG